MVVSLSTTYASLRTTRLERSRQRPDLWIDDMSETMKGLCQLRSIAYRRVLLHYISTPSARIILPESLPFLSRTGRIRTLKRRKRIKNSTTPNIRKELAYQIGSSLPQFSRSQRDTIIYDQINASKPFARWEITLEISSIPTNSGRPEEVASIFWETRNHLSRKMTYRLNKELTCYLTFLHVDRRTGVNKRRIQILSFELSVFEIGI